MIGGILNVNKPRGMTSFAVVSLVRRLTGIRKVGHAGTLDPIADGVLPICLGPATRIVDYIVAQPKLYRAAVRLGVATDTYDSEGEVVATGDPSGVSRDDVEQALSGFVGEIQQMPPMYSALKYRGQPLYRYARAGKTVPRKERTVRIYRLQLLKFDSPVVEIELEVGKGAYVRSIAHDMGEQLGCHAHMEQLTRVRSGPFTVDSAVQLGELEAAAERGDWEALLLPADRVLESWHAALLGEPHSRDVQHGQLLVLTPVGSKRIDLDTPCRAYSEDGEFLAILRYRGANRWHPETVFTAL